MSDLHSAERERFEAWCRTTNSMPCEHKWIGWQAALSAPPGYVLVPVEPTPEMMAAMIAAMNVWIKDIGEDADIYSAAIAAAPKEPHAYAPAAPADDPNLIGLLCLIHRDGGHYIQEHGLAKAVADAHEALYLWREAFDAAPSVAPEPVAWTLQSELDAAQTTCSAHLWFTNPRNSAWTALFTREQIAAHPPRAPQAPMTEEQRRDLVKECGLDWQRGFMPLFDGDPTNRYAVLIEAVEAAHGIGGK